MSPTRSLPVILLSAFLAAQQPAASSPLPTFALPKASWIEVSGTPKPLADPSIAQFIRNQADCRDCTQGISYPVSLGSLGRGTLLQIRGEVCGATGNCPFYLLLPTSGHPRIIPIGYGWSFALQKTPGGIPDVFTQANMSCCSGILQRFTYSKGSFKESGCDLINGALLGTKLVGGPNGDESTQTTHLTITHC